MGIREPVRPLVQNVTPPDLRSTAMALTEFINGAAASVIIILFSGYAKTHELTPALMILGCGAWSLAFILTIFYYVVYPGDAKRLRETMEQRSLILGCRKS